MRPKFSDADTMMLHKFLIPFPKFSLFITESSDFPKVIRFIMLSSNHVSPIYLKVIGLRQTKCALISRRNYMIKRYLQTWENMPKGVCSVRITWPLPPQVEHILILEPIFDPVPAQISHVSKWDNTISFSAPKIASENSKVMSYLTIFQVSVNSSVNQSLLLINVGSWMNLIRIEVEP